MATHGTRQAAGKNATAPSQYGWRDWGKLAIRIGSDIGSDHLSVIAAGVAFFAMLALFPAIAALIGVYGLIANPSDVATHMAQLRPLLPRDAYLIINGQIESLVGVASSRLGLASAVGLLGSLWSTRAAVGALMDGLNVVYEEKEQRSLLWFYLTSIALTLLLVLLAIIGIAAIVAVPTILELGNLGALGTWLVGLAPWPILTVVVLLAISVIYRYGPSRATARKRWVSPGAVVAAVLWVLASLAFSFYVANFADYNGTYGSLGAIVILLFWFYVGAFAVLLGAELNAEMELHTRRDTTTGPEKPMGKRGAYVADHVA